MKTTVTKSDFIAAFHNMGRGGQFTYMGLCELYDYLIEMENSSGEELELDVIALCCDFTEGDIEDIADECGIEDDRFSSVLEYLHKETVVVYGDSNTGMILYQNF